MSWVTRALNLKKKKKKAHRPRKHTHRHALLKNNISAFHFFFFSFSMLKTASELTQIHTSTGMYMRKWTAFKTERKPCYCELLYYYYKIIHARGNALVTICFELELTHIVNLSYRNNNKKKMALSKIDFFFFRFFICFWLLKFFIICFSKLKKKNTLLLFFISLYSLFIS